MRSKLWALSALIISGLLVGGTAATAAAQEAAGEPAGLAGICEANAPDEATLATCLDIVENVLAPGVGTAVSIQATTLSDVLYGTEAIVGENTFAGGIWTAFDEQGKRPKVGSKTWRAVAASTADDLGAYLLTVNPGPCNEDILLDVWPVYGAFKQAGAGAKSGDRLVDDAFTQLFMGMFDFPPECGPGWEP